MVVRYNVTDKDYVEPPKVDARALLTKQDDKVKAKKKAKEIKEKLKTKLLLQVKRQES
jgi:hypothetical protein